jgi:hypothetical protein
MGDIVINHEVFQERLGVLYTAWKSDKRNADGVFGGADSLVIVTGKADQDTIYHKNNAVHVSPSIPFLIRCAGDSRMRWLTMAIVLATWIRVSCDLDGFYDCGVVHCHD